MSNDHRSRVAGRLALAAFAAALAWPTPAAAQPAALAEQLRDACRAVRAVDRRRLTASDAGTARYHENLRTGAAAPPADHAGPLIRLSVHYSSPPPAANESAIAWKDGDGRWFVSRIGFSPRGDVPPGATLQWPHEPGIATDGLPPSAWQTGEGTLAPADAARLETMLASRCLEREPPVRPHELPIRRGPTLACYWHPTSFHLEITARGRRRALLRSCNSWQNADDRPAAGRWASDLVVELLTRSALVPAGAAASPAPADLVEIPERFRGRWAQLPERCDTPDGVWFEVGANGFTSSGHAVRPDRIEQRGPRTLVLHGPGSGLVHGVEVDRFVLPLLLSPSGDRMAVPDRITGWDHLFHRCPAAVTAP
ncbi:MAG TPA: hypothetical protein VEZ20_05935 [Allosphingosinicella sp.]|nr:hypothetical protein [Allosphingosinicella sp.]